MITKIHTSRSIAATVNYVMNPKKRAEVILSKGIFLLAGAEDIAREFEIQSTLRPEAKTKLLHIPMSFHVRDRNLMERDGQAIVREWLRRMEAYGFRFDQYIVVRHHDQDHKNPHFHLVINLTLSDGSAVKTSYIGKYAKLASMEVTRNWAMVARQSDAAHRAVNSTAYDDAICHFGIGTPGRLLYDERSSFIGRTDRHRWHRSRTSVRYRRCDDGAVDTTCRCPHRRRWRRLERGRREEKQTQK